MLEIECETFRHKLIKNDEIKTYTESKTTRDGTEKFADNAIGIAKALPEFSNWDVISNSRIPRHSILMGRKQ